MLGLIKLPNKALPIVAASLESAIGSASRIDAKSLNPLEFCIHMPSTWRPQLNFLTDIHIQKQQANREPYIHSPTGGVNRSSPAWVSLRLRYDVRARTILNRIRSAKLTGGVTWNGQFGDAALGALALRELGVPALFAELAPFKDRYFLDHLGVNAASSLEAARPETLPAYDDEDQLFDTLKSTYLGRRGSSKIFNDPSGLPKSFVFAPLQVPTDTQVMLHGGAVKSHNEYLGMLHGIAERLQTGVTLLVKPHPFSPYSDTYLRETIGKNIFIGTNYETRDLLERCTAIITINSSVGLDGFLFDKPIIAVGNAPWIKPALAAKSRDAMNIADLLARPPSFDKSLRKRFIAHWYHAYTWSAGEDPKRVREFLEAKLETARLCPGLARSA